MPGTADLDAFAPLSHRGGSAPVVSIGELRAGGALPGDVIRRIRDAIESPGYLLLDGLHGNLDSYGRVLDHMRDFFGRPDDDPVKRAVDVTGESDTNGWMPRGGEPAYQPGTRAHVESFDCGREEDGEPGGNRWPAVEGFRADVLRLWGELDDTGFAVMRALAVALGLPDDTFVQHCDSGELSTLRLLHYPALAAHELDNPSVGIAAHTDFECITLITQTSAGLELMDTGSAWSDVPSTDVAVVLFGDMLERWTNGVVRATGHRVRPQASERFSIARFFAVNDGVEVAPLPRFVAADRPAAYAAVTQRSHTRAELDRAERYRDDMQAR